MRTVAATLNYLCPMTDKPVFAPGIPGRTSLVLEPHTVSIGDARSLRGAPSLETEGFTLVQHSSRVSDFRSSEQVETRYLGEIAALIQHLTGADEVRASPGAVARYVDRSNAVRSSGTAPAARFVHTDYTDVSAREHFLPQLVKAEEALSRYRRIVVYQTWRALSGPPQDVPLAVVDGRSVRREDLVSADTMLGTEYSYAQSFEYSMCRFNPGHRWYYFSAMTPEDLLVFKGYDFDPSRTARLPQTAFDDPSVAAEAPPRASIEARAFAFFAH
jgi:hypothetical protein